MNIYKFVSWNVPALDTLKDSQEYKIAHKLDRGEKLTRSEKDSVYRGLFGNSYSHTGLPLQGWMFDLTEHLNKYAVEYKDGSMAKRFALDKTSIREHELYIARIYEIN